LKRLSKHNAWSRDYAVLYINGKVLRGSDFMPLLNDYLSENGKMQDFILDFIDKNPSVADKYEDENDVKKDIEIAEKQNKLPTAISRELGEFDREYGFNTGYKIAFAHEANNGIYIETDSLINCSLDDVVYAIRSKYPNYKIFDDNSCFMTSEDEKDYKQIVADIIGVDNYLVSINHEVFYGDNYFDAIENYFVEHGAAKKFNVYFVETFINENKDTMLDKAKKQGDFGIILDEVEKYLNDSRIAMGLPMAFAKEQNNTLFIDTNKLYNTTMQDAINDFKTEHPEMQIFDISNGEFLAKRKNKRKYSFKRLKKRISYHGIGNRDSALVYIDGEIIKGYIHPEIVQEYLDKNNLLYQVNKDYIESHDCYSDMSDEEKNELATEMTDAGMITLELHNDMSEFNRSENMPDIAGLPVAFAHLDDGNIYIDSNSIQNVDLNTVMNAFKREFPNSSIYKEDNNDELLLVARKQK